MRRFVLPAVLAAAVLAAPVGTAAAAPAFHPSPVRHVRANGVSLGYRAAGSGRPLVMIMGFGGTMAEWDPALVARLARHRRVIVFDNRGIARSAGAPVNRLTIAQMADDTAALIRALGYRRADVLGWSMGGNIGQELVLRHPGRVGRLILAATDPGSRRAIQPTDPAIVRVLNDPNVTPAQLLPVIFPANQQAAGRAYFTRVATGWPGVRAEDYATPPAVVAAQARAEGPVLWYCRRCGAFARLPRVRRPTLVTDGRVDVVEPPENSRILARRIPRARLILYPDAGHAHLFQDRVRYAADARRFLDR